MHMWEKTNLKSLILHKDIYIEGNSTLNEAQGVEKTVNRFNDFLISTNYKLEFSWKSVVSGVCRKLNVKS